MTASHPHQRRDAAFRLAAGFVPSLGQTFFIGPVGGAACGKRELAARRVARELRDAEAVA